MCDKKLTSMYRVSVTIGAAGYRRKVSKMQA